MRKLTALVSSAALALAAVCAGAPSASAAPKCSPKANPLSGYWCPPPHQLVISVKAAGPHVLAVTVSNISNYMDWLPLGDWQVSASTGMHIVLAWSPRRTGPVYNWTWQSSRELSWDRNTWRWDFHLANGAHPNLFYSARVDLGQPGSGLAFGSQVLAAASGEVHFPLKGAKR